MKLAQFVMGLLMLGMVHALALGADPVCLVKAGRSVSVLVVPQQAAPDEQLAAREIQEHVEKMSGARLEILTEEPSDGRLPVRIGLSLSPARETQIKAQSADAGAFVLAVGPREIVLAGLSAEGSLFAAYELLEQLGCRWFMPGDLGTVVPELKTVALAEQTTIQAPSFPSRHFQMPNREWQKRLRCGGPVFPSAHGIRTPKVKVDKQTGEIEPKEYAEFFALVNGKRTVRQHCVSNPKLIEYVVQQIKAARKGGRGPVIGWGPNDGGGFCQCEKCRALDGDDFDPFSGEAAVTDRYIWFFNQVLKGVEDEYPDTKLAFYIYHSYMRPPKRWKPDPRITGALAPISLDRVHGFSNPIAPEKSYAKWLYQEWGKIMPELYDRGYWSNLACPGFPFIIVHRLRDEIPACHDLGVKGWRVETFPNYGPQFPSMYIAGKLMWNHRADVDALLTDCYEKFFGPTRDPMGQYITMMDAALCDGDYCTGSAWDMPHFYPPALRAKARALLKEAERLAAGKGVYEERVAMIDDTFNLVEAFNNMMEARVRVDFVAAKAVLDKLDAVANRLMAMEPVPMLSAGRFSTYNNYMKRFFRPCTVEGHERVTGGNQLVAAANDEWEFQIDPARVGEEIGLWRAEITGGNWQKIRTSSSSWSNQGLRYYKGLAWYRQTLDVPARFADRRIFLWCGGVDDLAKVWINGRMIGISPGSAFYPFEMDATEAIRPGKNVVVICVSHQAVHELGTGGIVAPAILYAPVKGKDAQLRNMRDLKATFP